MNILETSYGRFHVYVNTFLLQEENLVHLSFVDKNNKTQIVLMRQINGRWYFANPEVLPHWIISLQQQFDNLITQEILNNYQPSAATTLN